MDAKKQLERLKDKYGVGKLSRRLNVSTSIIYKWISGEREISKIKIAEKIDREYSKLG